jgi:hypothetical protein
MNRRLFAGVISGIGALVMVPPPIGSARALECTAIPAPPERSGVWDTATQVTISYYNVCTGWSWSWTDMPVDGGGYGVVFDPGDEMSTLVGSWEFNAEAAWGRGFDSLVGVYSLDESGIPEVPPLIEKPYYPPAGWTYHPWGVPIDGPVLVFVRFEGWLSPVYTSPVTDHPAAGPDGSPPACGTCYPSPRDANTYRVEGPLSSGWPGEPFHDGTCEAELIWDATFSSAPTGVGDRMEQESWGRLRSLFR